LLEATIDLIRERNIDVLKRGAVFIDDSDFGMDARLLFYIEDAIQDGVILPNGTKRVISKNVHFVELKGDGSAQRAGYAPYLDYRAATPEEQAAIRPFIEAQDWLHTGVEERARGYAIANIIPAHFSEVRTHKHKMLDKIAKAVKERMTAEIQYWDFRAADLKQKEAAGKITQSSTPSSPEGAQRSWKPDAAQARRMEREDDFARSACCGGRRAGDPTRTAPQTCGNALRRTLRPRRFTGS
jgi:hypothetical protein